MKHSFLTRIDHWLAKRMFFPIIVRICQKFGWDQYTFAAYTAAIAVFVSLFNILIVQTGGMIYKGIVAVIYAVVLAYLALNGRFFSRPRGFWRCYSWGLLVFNLLRIRTEEGALAAGMWVLLLFVEYAFMIDRIPPLEKEQKQEKAAFRAAEA